jgi:type IV secretion system protein VirB11
MAEELDIFLKPPSGTELELQIQEDPLQFAVLNAIIGKIKPYFTHPDVEEIAINRPGEIWLKRRRPKEGEDIWHPVMDPELNFDYLERVCKVVANTADQKFGYGADQVPVVYSALPGGHRFSAGMYKNFVYQEATPKGGVAMCIRQAPRGDSIISYDAYGLSEGVRVKALPKFKETADDSKDDLEKLKKAIDRGSHLIVSGATSTGKTTLLNRIISDLQPSLRVATVEDTRELVVPHRNRFHIVLSRTEQTNKFNDAGAINFLTRATPDIIICGEISTENAKTIWELTGSGHGNMMTTIHAEDPESAIKTFIQRMQHHDKNINVEETAKEMRKRFTVVQIVRDHHTGRRRITHIETFRDED